MAKSTTSFQDFKLNKQLLNAIEDSGYITPTPIQKKTIPLILAGHDVMGIAQTGTGKTAAFVWPLLMKVKYAQGNDPRGLILAPTKELVLQIEDNIRTYGVYCDIRYIALYGGIGPQNQIQELNKGVDIIVSTPGRFMDLYARGEINTKLIETLILDEADKMMDMGFMPQIRKVLEIIPVKRQNLLFSATMPERVITLSEEFLEYPEMIEVTPQATTADTITQGVYKVPNIKTKLNLLLLLLEDKKLYHKVMIFTKTKVVADNIYKYLLRKDQGEIRVIHSNKGQNTRINSVEEFKKGLIRILVATDVASRGLDVSLISHVINFDVPTYYEDYVHRIGRTGRANKKGTAVTFCNEAEEYHLHKIEQLIRTPIPNKKFPNTVKIEKTDVEEKQKIAREIDQQKKFEDPEFKGAFHEKKRKNTKQRNKKNSYKGKSKRR